MAHASVRSAGTPSESNLASAIRGHPGFTLVETVIFLAAAALDTVVALHPGPLPGDVGVTLLVQHAILPHGILAALLKDDSVINWPRPAIATAAVFVLGFALFRRWLDILTALGTLVAAAGSNFVTNQLIARPRPDGHGIVVDQHVRGAFSYPSGHVEHTVAFLGIVVFLTLQLRSRSPWLQGVLWVFRLVLLTEVLVMPLSRALEGEHWPSDILAGAMYGGFWLVAAIQVYPWAARRWPALVPRNERRGRDPMPARRDG